VFFRLDGLPKTLVEKSPDSLSLNQELEKLVIEISSTVIDKQKMEKALVLHYPHHSKEFLGGGRSRPKKQAWASSSSSYANRRRFTLSYSSIVCTDTEEI
jgi:hypothetical protein